MRSGNVNDLSRLSTEISTIGTFLSELHCGYTPQDCCFNSSSVQPAVLPIAIGICDSIQTEVQRRFFPPVVDGESATETAKSWRNPEIESGTLAPKASMIPLHQFRNCLRLHFRKIIPLMFVLIISSPMLYKGWLSDFSVGHCTILAASTWMHIIKLHP